MKEKGDFEMEYKALEFGNSNRRSSSKEKLRFLAVATAVLICALTAIGCGGSSGASVAAPEQLVFEDKIIVNSTADVANPPAGSMTLRAALAQAGGTKKVVFNRALNGQTIVLNVVGESHSVLKGEVYAGGPPVFQGYQDRDYGKSALYVHGDVILDASELSNGVTIAWTGGDANPARVLAVYGNLTLDNVRITGGISKAEILSEGTQGYTLARGGGLAVWGLANLKNCVVSGNRIIGDDNATRDRGAYGGGIYANGLVMDKCVVSGNTATGYGAAGGGIYSVGGADNTTGFGNDAVLTRSSITGNRVTAQHSYGGGIFTLSGGPSNLATMRVTNCTIARNVIEDNPALPEVGQWYTRGGGIYMGGGSLTVISSTIAENEVNGIMASFSGKPNMAGGGIAATIGDAHVVEDLVLQNSIVVGNKMTGSANDVFTGTVLDFQSNGYNVIGMLDFSQILVPVPLWGDLSRKHYPMAGDRDGVTLAEALSLTEIQRHDTAISAGTDSGQHALLWYMPATVAIDKVPKSPYMVSNIQAEYAGSGASTDDFLNQVLAKLRTEYSAQLGGNFAPEYGDMTGVTWYGAVRTWPSNPLNVPWIAFWRNIDTDLAGRLGTAGLNDDFWGRFTTGPLGANVSMVVTPTQTSVQLTAEDQRGNQRSASAMGDIGAIEK